MIVKMLNRSRLKSVTTIYPQHRLFLSAIAPKQRSQGAFGLNYQSQHQAQQDRMASLLITTLQTYNSTQTNSSTHQIQAQSIKSHSFLAPRQDKFGLRQARHQAKSSWSPLMILLPTALINPSRLA